MATATSGKQNLQFVLDTIELPALKSAGVNKHLAILELVWPRTGIARRSSTLTLPFVNGLCATDAWSMGSKLCFKETCEGNFALRVSITETVSTTKIRNFMRYFLGKTADVAGDAIEDAISVPVVDEVAAVPLYYLSKQLLGTADPELIAEGCLDLDTADFTKEPALITVPLTFRQTIVTHRQRGAKFTAVSSTVKSQGKAVFSVKAY